MERNLSDDLEHDEDDYADLDDSNYWDPVDLWEDSEDGDDDYLLNEGSL